MNRTSPGFLLSKALLGLEQYKAAEGISPNTLIAYMQHLKLWLEYTGDVEVGQVTAQQVRAFLAWLRTEYEPRRITGNRQPLSSKTVRNIWVTLSSFFRWASSEFNLPNPMMGVPAPRFEEAPVEPHLRFVPGSSSYPSPCVRAACIYRPNMMS